MVTGGCHFRSQTLSNSEPGTAIELHELEFSPNSCRSLVVYGKSTVVPELDPDVQDGHRRESVTIGPIPFGSDVVSRSPMIRTTARESSRSPTSGFTSHLGYHKSWFRDPPTIDVNSVKAGELVRKWLNYQHELQHMEHA